MVDDIDIWRAAQQMIGRYGAQATTQAETRRALALEAADAFNGEL